MNDRRTTVIVLISALTAFLLNFLLDVTTDLPMLVRWVVAIAGALLVTMVLARRRARGRGRSRLRWSQGRSNGPRGQS